EKLYLAFLYAPPEEQTRQFVLANIRDGNPQLVVIVADNVVGWCDVVRDSFHVKAHCGTLGIALLPGFRGKGIGRKLMHAAIQAAWAGGFRRINLTVRSNNTQAVALYKQLGFAQEGHHRQAVQIDGNYFDLYSMALLHPSLVSTQMT
ncbi:MAG TPA: GNAT family N-acetyltransferase, partial [Rhodocyclaceae bacterium]|nr:GNAT family N-acetyltransferase [Rhodocyclaceae bacterium]